VGQDAFDHLPALGTNLAGPFHDATGRPFQIPLMRLKAVFIQSRELAGQSAARVGGQALAVVKQLHRLLRQTHIQLAMNQAVRCTVKMVVHRPVIIDVDLGLAPSGELERLGRQGQQLVLFLAVKPAFARTLQPLERLRVKLVRQRSNGLVEFADAAKTRVEQHGQNLPSGNERASFDLGLIARLFWPGRQYGGAEVLRQDTNPQANCF